MRRIKELDGLRAIAIFLVLGCHYEGFSRLAQSVPEFGWIGVDLFFSLSGYLITTILLGLRGRPRPYRTFYSRRLIRILPPYLAVLAVVGVFVTHRHEMTMTWIGTQLLFLQAAHTRENLAVWDVLTHVRWYLHHSPSLLRYAHGLPAEQVGAPLSVLIVPYVLWSLSVEEYFYLLWAPVVLRFSNAAVLSVGAAVCVGEILLRWAIATPEIQFGLAFRFDALLYGAFLALLLHHWRRTGLPRRAQAMLMMIVVAAAGGVAWILFTIRPVLGRNPRYSTLALAFGLPLLSIMFTGLIGILILRADGKWWLGKILRSQAFQFVGTISYTMYLVHLIAAATVRSLSGVKDVYQQTFVQAVLSTLLTIGIAQLSWIFLEKKALHWKDKHFPNMPHPPEPNVPGLGG